ncbi:MAG: helix-turn-helix domain-containing protein, partial [Desulfobacterales bacterium]|nr:helix-turn-helix domain-containing protein [Desulfobacterales bacterium]
MANQQQILTVARVAALCGVNRNTVGLWIRSRKLHAVRKGRNYSIPASELLFFLKSTGRKIPAELVEETTLAPHFRTVQNCWDYFQGNKHLNGCRDCVVHKNQLDVCFVGKESSATVCGGKCGECRYFQETFLPRIQLVHQIDMPAAVYKDFYLWCGNKNWARVIGQGEKDLIGLGIENVFHQDSLGIVMASFKKRALGDPAVPRTDYVYVVNARRDKIAMTISAYPLVEPAGAWLLLGE